MCHWIFCETAFRKEGSLPSYYSEAYPQQCNSILTLPLSLSLCVCVCVGSHNYILKALESAGGEKDFPRIHRPKLGRWKWEGGEEFAVMAFKGRFERGGGRGGPWSPLYPFKLEKIPGKISPRPPQVLLVCDMFPPDFQSRPARS